MIVSEKSYQNLSDYIQLLFKKYRKLIKKWLLLVKKWEIQVIISMIMLTRSSERIFNPMRYTGNSIREFMKTGITRGNHFFQRSISQTFGLKFIWQFQLNCPRFHLLPFRNRSIFQMSDFWSQNCQLSTLRNYKTKMKA